MSTFETTTSVSPPAPHTPNDQPRPERRRRQSKLRSPRPISSPNGSVVFSPLRSPVQTPVRGGSRSGRTMISPDRRFIESGIQRPSIRRSAPSPLSTPSDAGSIGGGSDAGGSRDALLPAIETPGRAGSGRLGFRSPSNRNSLIQKPKFRSPTNRESGTQSPAVKSPVRWEEEDEEDGSLAERTALACCSTAEDATGDIVGDNVDEIIDDVLGEEVINDDECGVEVRKFAGKAVEERAREEGVDEAQDSIITTSKSGSQVEDRHGARVAESSEMELKERKFSQENTCDDARASACDEELKTTAAPAVVEVPPADQEKVMNENNSREGGAPSDEVNNDLPSGSDREPPGNGVGRISKAQPSDQEIEIPQSEEAETHGSDSGNALWTPPPASDPFVNEKVFGNEADHSKVVLSDAVRSSSGKDNEIHTPTPSTTSMRETATGMKNRALDVPTAKEKHAECCPGCVVQ